MTQTIKNKLGGNLRKYKSIPFWSWNNYLNEEELIKQIEDMRAAEIGGFIMHARTGLKEEYLGEKWFSCIDACLKKAKELDMEAWIYDENGWPSGFVGGKLLEKEEYRARFLEYAVGEFDKGAYASYIEDEERGYVRVETPCEGISTYHNVYLRISPANTDILNPDVVDAFIEETHEKYYARFKESFGRELVGFFTDEPQFYRWATPYTPMLERYFDDVREGLIWLFVQDEKGYAFRQKYYRTLNNLYVDVFYKKLYDWCKARGVLLTGHSVEEPYLFTQMYGGAAVMPSYEYEDIPGIDCLERQNMWETSPKQVASVAAQLGKEVILTETFGCAGNDVTPRELKSIAESQYFFGVNKMCQHLYPYSIAEQGKIDHPPVFGAHSNWLKQFKTFNEYFNRLGCVIANTKEKADIAVLHPIGEIWLDYIRTLDYQSVAEIENSFTELLVALRKRGVCYHFVDERILDRHGKVAGDELRVGERTYGGLIIPKMRSIRKSTYEKLLNYQGKLCILGDLQYIDGEKTSVCLRSNVGLEELIASFGEKFFCADGNSFITERVGELGEFLFVKNNSSTENSRVVFNGVAEEYCALDLENLTERNIANDITLLPNESLILIKSAKATPTKTEKSKKSITKAFKTTEISENYLLLDYAQISRDGVCFGESYPIVGHFEELLREDYKGEVFVRQTFTVKEKTPLTLIMEKAKFKLARLNGQDLIFTQSDMDVNFIEAALGDKVKTGENELLYCIDFWQHDGVHFALFDPLATESLRNCLYYDTSIQPAYIKGDFTVEGNALCKRAQLPPVTHLLYQQGYPFFRGTIALEGSFSWDGETPTTLGIEGRFLVAELTVNGKTEELTLSTEKEITRLLQKGENHIKILLRSSNRNLFGPHHFKADGDTFGVSPYHFQFRGGWQDGKYPPNFVKEYTSVPFGVKEIYISEIKNIIL